MSDFNSYTARRVEQVRFFNIGASSSFVFEACRKMRVSLTSGSFEVSDKEANKATLSKVGDAIELEASDGSVLSEVYITSVGASSGLVVFYGGDYKAVVKGK